MNNAYFRGVQAKFKDFTELNQYLKAAKNLNKTAVFVMTLKRKIAYHIISVYLPSATIFFISLVTMYVHIKHVEATIMVHLTAMLVMYTLFQAISISLPKVTQKCPKL